MLPGVLFFEDWLRGLQPQTFFTLVQSLTVCHALVVWPLELTSLNVSRV
jgi:hypothetical protein